MEITREFIDTVLGGTDAVATKVRKKPNAVRMWVHRGTIPRAVWPDLLEAYPRLKLRDLKAVESAAEKARQARA